MTRFAAARLVDRFSQMAIATVVAVGVTGVYLGWKEVGSLHALTSTRYGLTLVAKLIVVAFVGALAAYNHWRLRARHPPHGQTCGDR